MRVIGKLFWRNFLIFMRDKGAVFFSILSMLIVLGLMILFLGSMNRENILEVLQQWGGVRNLEEDKENAEYLVQMWTLAGILIVNSVTVTMTVMGNMIKDDAQNRLFSFYIAPIRRGQIALGYILSAWVIGVMMCLFTLAAAQGYMAITGAKLLSVTAWFKLTGMIFLNTFVYAAIAYLVALFVHSESSWSGLLTVIGTLVGFVGGIYLPMAMLPEKVVDILKCLPVLHGAAMMRVVCVEEAVKETFADMPEEVITAFQENMGVTITFHEKMVSLQMQSAYLILLSILVVAAAVIISKKKEMHDR